MWQDTRVALHGIRRSPAFAVAVTLSLGLAMGANAALFGVVDALWLRPPGIAAPGSLVRVFSTTQSSVEGPWSFPEYQDLRDRTTTFAALAARGRRGTSLRLSDGTSELELVNVVSLNFFTMTAVKPAAGRMFTPADEGLLQREPVVVLGNDFWRRRYGADPSIVGKQISIGREGWVGVTVLGVLPDTFRDLDPASDRDLWLPPATWARLAGAAEFEQRDYRWFEVFGARKRGATVQQANAEVTQLANALAQSYPDSNRGRGARAVSDLSYRLEVGGVNAFALLGLVLLVAIITCVNVANLLLARGAGRAREIAVRVALGASRFQLLRQLMIESVVLGTLSAAVGLMIGGALMLTLPAIIGAPPGMRSFVIFAMDQRVLVFTLGVTLATTVAFGLVPSWLVTHPNVVPVLKGETGLHGALAGHRTLRAVLVAGQVAVAIVVLCSAAVLARSFIKSARADLGLTRSPLLLAWVTFADVERPLADEALARVRALPGVRDVAIAIRAPLSLSGGGRAQRVFVPGTNPDASGGVPEIKFNAVSASYFRALGVRLVEGRTFGDADQRIGPRTVVVSAQFQKKFFPGGAIGRTVRLGSASGPEHEVIGVVADAVINAVGEEAEPYFYLPFWRARYGEMTVIVDAGDNSGALTAAMRDTLRRLDPRLDPRTLVTLRDLIEYSETSYRATAVLAVGIGVVGLLLTAIGVYGLVSLNTTARTREIGIRVALGAARGQVLRLVLQSGLLLALAGTAAGLPVALIVTRLLASLLFDMSPWDPPAYAVAIAVVFACVAAATFIPAQRVARISPSAALREA